MSEGDQEKQQERFRAKLRAYVDDELSGAERAAFDAERARSPELDADFVQYRRMVDLLRGLPEERAPRRFVDRVEGRIRRRSHGTYFPIEPRVRLPYEAIATIILLCAVVLLFVHAAPPREMPVIHGPAPGTAVSQREPILKELASFGIAERRGRRIVVLVAPEREAAFREALSARPALRVDSRSTVPGDPRIRYVLKLPRRSPGGP